MNITNNYYWTGFRSKGPMSIIGLVFTCVALFVMVPIQFVMPKLLQEPYERYNYKEIVQKGECVTARVNDVEVKYNVTVNGIHPRVISYDYVYQGSTFADKFQTMEVKQADALLTNDSINVSVWKGASVINNRKLFTFPFQLFWIMPAIFLLVGLPMLYQGHLAGKRSALENHI